MLSIVDIVYDNYDGCTDYEQVLAHQANTLAFAGFLPTDVQYHIVRHLDYEGIHQTGNVHYSFFKRKNKSWQIPLKTHRYIQALNPDVVIVQGFIFPLQVIALKAMLPRKSVVLLQHHGETPKTSIRLQFQKIADRFVDSYMFTSANNAYPWLEKSVIDNSGKIVEITGASVLIDRKLKMDARQRLGLPSTSLFLWVGRLNENKDPLTVLSAFERYLQQRDADLYMIYQDGALLEEIQCAIMNSELLRLHVKLLGKIEFTELPDWYSAADFFVAASWRESCGYALIESMLCGCIPIVTAIPSFKKITGDGKVGFLFEPGNSEELLQLFLAADTDSKSQLSDSVHQFALQTLHPEKIADDVYQLCLASMRKKLHHTSATGIHG